MYGYCKEYMIRKEDMMKYFDKVIGYDDIKNELNMVCDILNDPDKYVKLGVSTPRGILLHGAPGVGKTLLANSFIEASGRKAYLCRKNMPNGKFVDHIREVFKKAQDAGKSIVFLDDLDKFANDDEEHQNSEEYITIQSCIDDMEGKDILVLATANSIWTLPDSLVRHGRFDRIIKMDEPTGEDAVKIIKYYLSEKSTVAELDSEEVARILGGYSCATLKSVINEAGIYAGFAGKEKIDFDDIAKACLRLIFKAPENMSKEDRQSIDRIAYHEAGHAVIAEILEPGSVSLVSVRRHGKDIGGFTRVKNSDGYFYSKEAMENRVCFALGGKAASEIVFGEADTGTNNDLREAFDIVERFVDSYCSYGFGAWQRFKSGHMVTENKDMRITSEMERYYEQTKSILARNREMLDRIAGELMEKETLFHIDIKALKSVS
jgi:cell division protease FtsH